MMESCIVYVFGKDLSSLYVGYWPLLAPCWYRGSIAQCILNAKDEGMRKRRLVRQGIGFRVWV